MSNLSVLNRSRSIARFKHVFYSHVGIVLEKTKKENVRMFRKQMNTNGKRINEKMYKNNSEL